MDGWDLIDDSVEARGVLLPRMKRDGTRNVFLGQEGAPKGFGGGMEGRDDL